jgi:hypothetical protein
MTVNAFSRQAEIIIVILHRTTKARRHHKDIKVSQYKNKYDNSREIRVETFGNRKGFRGPERAKSALQTCYIYQIFSQGSH